MFLVIIWSFVHLYFIMRVITTNNYDVIYFFVYFSLSINSNIYINGVNIYFKSSLHLIINFLKVQDA